MYPIVLVQVKDSIRIISLTGHKIVTSHFYIIDTCQIYTVLKDRLAYLLAVIYLKHIVCIKCEFTTVALSIRICIINVSFMHRCIMCLK